MTTNEGCSSVSDKAGNLLFYTDGSIVWNKHHQIMANGVGLYGNTSSTHSSVVIKKPLSNTEYYIITSDADPAFDDGVNFTIIDMDYNGGTGRVTQPNNPLVPASAEKIAVTPHRNRKDLWVAIPELNSTKLHIFRVTETGFKLNAIDSNLIPEINFGPGQIKFSPDGQHLAIVFSDNNTKKSKVYILNFNNSTGALSPGQIITGGKYLYGAEFSPSSEYLYLTSILDNNVYQCKIVAGATTNLSDCFFLHTESGFGQMQLGPDQKIYLAKRNFSALGVIEFPDSSFAKIGFNETGAGLMASTTCNFGLPTLNTSYITPPAIDITNPCSGDTTLFSIDTTSSTYDSLQWLINGEPILQKRADGYYVFNQAGQHSIGVIVYNEGYADTVVKSVEIQQSPIDPNLEDTSVCNNRPVVFNAFRETNVSYLWNTGSTDSCIAVEHPGKYTVTLTKNECTLRSTFVLYSISLPYVDLGIDTAFCPQKLYLLNAAFPYSKYLWSTGSTDSLFLVQHTGWYSVSVENNCGIKTDSVFLKEELCDCVVWAPNAFTPNGDLTNDVFIPSLSCDYTGFDFRIYSKWGEEVFHSTSILNTWDGRYKGSYAPADVYVWKLSCVLANKVGAEFRNDSNGTVTLLR